VVLSPQKNLPDLYRKRFSSYLLVLAGLSTITRKCSYPIAGIAVSREHATDRNTANTKSLNKLTFPAERIE